MRIDFRIVTCLVTRPPTLAGFTMTNQIPHPPWPLEIYRDRHGVRSWIDRAELDALFAIRHPLAVTQTFSLADRHTLRADPPILLLVPDNVQPPDSIDLRFCRSIAAGRPAPHHVLARSKRSRRRAGPRNRRAPWTRHARYPRPSDRGDRLS
jgi:hypothetical protein